jgi:DNA repair exonuclease SbcCD ATPase subunit
MIDVQDFIEIDPKEYEEKFSVSEKLDEDVKHDLFHWLFYPNSNKVTSQIIRLIIKLHQLKSKSPFIRFNEYINFYFLVKEDYDVEEANIIRCIEDIDSSIDERRNWIEDINSDYGDLEEKNTQLEVQLEELEDKLNDAEIEDEIQDIEYEIDNLKSEISSNKNDMSDLESKSDDLNQQIDELEDDKERVEDFLNELQNWDLSL